MTAITMAAPGAASSNNTFSLQNTFSNAVRYTVDTAKQAIGLAYDFIKANPIVSAIAADFVFTGGHYTQKATVAAVKTAAGAAGDLGASAGKGIWSYLFN